MTFKYIDEASFKALQAVITKYNGEEDASIERLAKIEAAVSAINKAAVTSYYATCIQAMAEDEARPEAERYKAAVQSMLLDTAIEQASMRKTKDGSLLLSVKPEGRYATISGLIKAGKGRISLPAWKGHLEAIRYMAAGLSTSESQQDSKAFAKAFKERRQEKTSAFSLSKISDMVQDALTLLGIEGKPLTHDARYLRDGSTKAIGRKGLDILRPAAFEAILTKTLHRIVTKGQYDITDKHQDSLESKAAKKAEADKAKDKPKDKAKGKPKAEDKAA